MPRIPETIFTFFMLICEINAVGILVQNKILDVPALATYEIIGLKGCAKQCIRRSGQCLAFTYQKKHLLCNLLDTTSAIVPDKLKAKDGFTYSEINTWSEDLGKCKTVNCPVGKTCLELSSGKTSCQFDPTACPMGTFFNGSGCPLCPEGEYQPSSGQRNCSICPEGEGPTWKMSTITRTICQGCWYGIGTYTEGDDSKLISTHTVADRGGCYSLCKADPNCLAVKSTQSNTKCALFSSKTWKYGYVLDSVVILVRGHCRP
ncbi:uncharacterized protein LOC133202928 [Saccostrea echinata]|uniref:uncharacterized protein LOC133202928 n=1 Tax=Saccostrea echinata TaxID=191078 RepID=UPI002A82F209|nr:uncharacterized protein LOC133202928 [Saccostrea echinata]